MMRKIYLVACFLVSSAFIQADDLQYWAAFNWKLFQRNDLTVNFYSEMRVRDDVNQAFGYFFGPTFRYKVMSRLTVGGGAKMIHFKGGAGFARLQRYEAEATYNFNVGKLRFDHRNRYEYFRRETASNRPRLRSRFGMRLPLNKGRLKRFFCSFEYLYLPKTHQTQAYRFVPAGISFSVSKDVSLSAYYMREHQFNGSVDNNVLGTTLSF